MRIAGLILAGGQARRLGGRDKALVALNGKPLMAYAFATLTKQTAPVLISAAGDLARFGGLVPGVAIADDLPGFQGPLAGILAGLDFLARTVPDVSHMLSLPVDTPFAPGDMARRLQAAMALAGVPASAAYAGRLHPAVTLWPLATRQALRAMVEGDDIRAVTKALARLNGVSVAWDDLAYDPFFNINSAEDLARAEVILAERSGLDD